MKVFEEKEKRQFVPVRIVLESTWEVVTLQDVLLAYLNRRGHNELIDNIMKGLDSIQKQYRD